MKLNVSHLHIDINASALVFTSTSSDADGPSLTHTPSPSLHRFTFPSRVDDRCASCSERTTNGSSSPSAQVSATDDDQTPTIACHRVKSHTLKVVGSIGAPYNFPP